MIPNEQNLMNNIGEISYTLDKSYLDKLEIDYDILPFDECYNKDNVISYLSNIRALKIKRFVINKEEKVNDCIRNVLTLFSNSNETIALVIKRMPNSVEIYFVIKNIGLGRNEDSRNNIELLSDAIKGNFPGTEVEVVEEKNCGDDTAKSLGIDHFSAVSILSNIPSEKSEDFTSQGIEKLLNGVVPQGVEDSYTIAFVSESIKNSEIRNMINGYEELATALAPFSEYQFQSGTNETDTQGEMESLSHSKGVSHSISKTHSVNIGGNASSSNSISANVFGNLFGFGGTSGISNTKGAGVSAGYGYSWGTTDTKSETDTKTTGTNRSISMGSSENTTYTYKSHLVGNLIDKLETTIERIESSKSDGLWKYAVYIFSENAKTTTNVANFLNAILQGDDSYTEPSFVQTWVKANGNGVDIFTEIQKYVKHFSHPVFGNIVDGTLVLPSYNISTSEVANAYAFPRHSVNSIPVIECVRFGREPHSLANISPDIPIGKSYHMHHEECSYIKIDKDKLTAHTFITGSTGSGKSNTVYKMLDEVTKQGVKFMVIEPAKGEYKDVFGGRDDVTVYGTNPYKSPNLLGINPFSFPEDIHVLEHIDRLVEIFNACWPMYAAMPAILKDAIEQSYEECGWDLRSSKGSGKFPTFEILLNILPKVVDSSNYSADTSSDYKGALVTRVRSLTKGINGIIFESDVDFEKLFNENAIVDLSRIGTNEIKSLIMGMLVLKLQEFRMSENTKNNSGLRHITVLEEAHNLLRRTSSEQSQESSNLQGKSVEMIANAIAEMRTYGEGFIIADQSPGLMDMSVIRNTNTKIIMRLPDESDRQLVGKSAGLNDDQIVELSRLDTGVAAVYQNSWLEPVLCKVDRFEDEKPLKVTEITWKDDKTNTKNSAIKAFLNNAFGIDRRELTKEEVDLVRGWYCSTILKSQDMQYFNAVINNIPINKDYQTMLVYSLFKDTFNAYTGENKVSNYVNSMQQIQLMFEKYGINANDRIILQIQENFKQLFEVEHINISELTNLEKGKM